MPPKLVIPPEVDELVLRFGELEIGINVRRASSPTGASSTWELVSAADSSTGTGASLAALPHVSSNLAASSAADFAALPLGFWIIWQTSCVALTVLGFLRHEWGELSRLVWWHPFVLKGSVPR